MAALPYMQLYVADYLADTAHLSAAQHGAYLLLLFNYWQRGKPLNNSNERLANVARMSNDEWLSNKASIAEFFDIEGDEWRHSRIEDDLAAVHAKSTKASASGKASANKRSTNVQRTFNERSTNDEQTFNHTDTDTDTEEKNICTLEQVEDASPEPEKLEHKKSPVNGTAISLKTFLSRCQEAGERPIGDYKPVWEYADRIGIPEDSVVLCWQEFVRKFGNGGARESKRYRDWRQAFRNCVEDNWFHIWALDEQGRAILTTKGRIAEKINA